MCVKTAVNLHLSYKKYEVTKNIGSATIVAVHILLARLYSGLEVLIGGFFPSAVGVIGYGDAGLEGVTGMIGLAIPLLGLAEDAVLGQWRWVLVLVEAAAECEAPASVTAAEVGAAASVLFGFVVAAAFALLTVVAADVESAAVTLGCSAATALVFAMDTLAFFPGRTGSGFSDASATFFAAVAAGASVFVEAAAAFFLFFVGTASTVVVLAFFPLDKTSAVAPLAAFVAFGSFFSEAVEAGRMLWQLVKVALPRGVTRGPAVCQLLPHPASMRIPSPSRDIVFFFLYFPATLLRSGNAGGPIQSSW